MAGVPCSCCVTFLFYSFISHGEEAKKCVIMKGGQSHSGIISREQIIRRLVDILGKDQVVTDEQVLKKAVSTDTENMRTGNAAIYANLSGSSRIC